MKQRVFSGIQPTGNIHIGNYLGAIRHWVASQAEFDNTFCIVDLHAITTQQQPAALKSKIREVAGLLFAVGEDQKQHLELTRHVAQRFNSIYGETFKVPKPVIPKTGARIMGLANPTKKMSKSETAFVHAVHLLDSPDNIRLKISRATTDSQHEIRFDENRPGIYNLLVVFELLTGLSRPAIEARFEGKDYSNFKRELADVIIGVLRPLQSRYRELTADLQSSTHCREDLEACKRQNWTWMKERRKCGSVLVL